jgi:hypothetical protein
MGEIANSFYSSLNTLNAMDEQHTQNQLAKQAGTAMAGGDYTGAANAFYKGGDVANGMKVQDAGSQLQDQQRKREAEGALAIAKGVRGIVASGKAGDPNDPATYQKAYQAAMQYAPSLGVDPKHLQQMAPAFQADPQGFLNFMEAQAQKELVKGENGEIGTYNKDTGAYNQIHGPTKPITYKADEYVYMPGQGVQPGTAGQAAPAQPAAGGGAFDAPGFIKSFVLPHEGGLNPSDINGSPTNFGINQKANPGVNVAKLTPDGAAQIYQNKYLPMSGAANLPPALAGPVLDTAIINPSKAKQFLAQSGGDPNKFMDLREAWLNNLAAKSPGAAKYAQAWSKRNADLRSYIAQQGGAAAGAQQASAPTQPSIPGYQLIHSPEAAAGDDSALDGQTIDLLAGRYLKDGTLPPMGMGKAAAANRSAILKAASAKAKELGINADDLVAGTVSVKAGASALQKVAGTTELIRASEQTVEKNLQIALRLSHKVGGPTGVPVFNRWIQSGRKNIAGDADVAALNQAVGTVADEYAKVMTTTNGAGAGMTSDSARNEAYKRINAAMTPQQLEAVVGVMRQEMQNRLQSYQETQTGILNSIRGVNSANGGSQQAATQAPPADRPPLSAFQR